MKLYSVFVRENKQQKIDDLIFIKEGFSFLAFIFGTFWFLYNKIWLKFFFFLLLGILFSKLHEAEILGKMEYLFFSFMLSIFIAMNAKEYKTQKLQSLKYKRKFYILANNYEEARIKGFKLLEESEKEKLNFDEIGKNALGFEKFILLNSKNN